MKTYKFLDKKKKRNKTQKKLYKKRNKTQKKLYKKRNKTQKNKIIKGGADKTDFKSAPTQEELKGMRANATQSVRKDRKEERLALARAKTAASEEERLPAANVSAAEAIGAVIGAAGAEARVAAKERVGDDDARYIASGELYARIDSIYTQFGRESIGNPPELAAKLVNLKESTREGYEAKRQAILTTAAQEAVAPSVRADGSKIPFTFKPSFLQDIQSTQNPLEFTMQQDCAQINAVFDRWEFQSLVETCPNLSRLPNNQYILKILRDICASYYMGVCLSSRSQKRHTSARVENPRRKELTKMIEEDLEDMEPNNGEAQGAAAKTPKGAGASAGGLRLTETTTHRKVALQTAGNRIGLKVISSVTNSPYTIDSLVTHGYLPVLDADDNTAFVTDVEDYESSHFVRAADCKPGTVTVQSFLVALAISVRLDPLTPYIFDSLVKANTAASIEALFSVTNRDNLAAYNPTRGLIVAKFLEFYVQAIVLVDKLDESILGAMAESGINFYRNALQNFVKAQRNCVLFLMAIAEARDILKIEAGRGTGAHTKFSKGPVGKTRFQMMRALHARGRLRVVSRGFGQPVSIEQIIQKVEEITEDSFLEYSADSVNLSGDPTLFTNFSLYAVDIDRSLGMYSLGGDNAILGLFDPITATIYTVESSKMDLFNLKAKFQGNPARQDYPLIPQLAALPGFVAESIRRQPDVKRVNSPAHPGASSASSAYGAGGGGGGGAGGGGGGGAGGGGAGGGGGGGMPLMNAQGMNKAAIKFALMTDGLERSSQIIALDNRITPETKRDLMLLVLSIRQRFTQSGISIDDFTEELFSSSNGDKDGFITVGELFAFL